MARKSKKPPHVYLLSAARKVWYWSDQRKAAIARASVGPDLVRCTCCKKLLPKKSKPTQFAVDHVDPVVPPGVSSPQIPNTSKENQSWDEYLERLMFGEQQVLCKPCHKDKTNEENRARKKAKR